MPLSSFLLLALLTVFLLFLPARAQDVPAPDPENLRQLADEVERHFRQHTLAPWYPRSVDKQRGGFHAAFTRDWSPGPDPDRFIVFQARMPWTSAFIALRRPDLRDEHLAYAKHGLDYLHDVMWDREHGGFHWLLAYDAQHTPMHDGVKHLYGESFGLYAAAAAYEATQDPRALDLAQRAFRWLEAHAHDERHGGYHESLTREGKVMTGSDDPAAPKAFPVAGFPVGYKSMNAHIHMMEALTQLHRVWADDLVRRRLVEVHDIVRDRVAVEPGCLNLYFTPDWRPVPDHDSPGHDIETAYLLIEAAHQAGIEGAELAKTMRMARMLTDHTLNYAWDAEQGGIYNKAGAFEPAYDRSKSWWCQFESLNALLLMHELHGRETPRYWEAFVQQWRQIQRQQTDAQHGGHWNTLGPDGKPTDTVKASNWKGAYHEGRAMIEVADRLRKLAGRE